MSKGNLGYAVKPIRQDGEESREEEGWRRKRKQKDKGEGNKKGARKEDEKSVQSPLVPLRTELSTVP